MGAISSLWGRVALRFSKLPTSGLDYYGILNQQFVVLPLAGSTVTKANFVTYWESGYFGGRAVGVWNPPIGSGINFVTNEHLGYLAPAETRLSGDMHYGFFAGTGTGAGLTGGAATGDAPSMTTGSTATGTSRLYVYPVVANIDRASLSDMYFSVGLKIDALSTSAQRALVSVDMTCGDIGLVNFSQVDNVNSGNMVVKYYNSANALVTLNTTQALPAGSSTTLVVTALKSGSTWTLGVSINNVSVLSTTATQINAATAVGSDMGVVDAKITKSVGTTPRLLYIETFYSVCT